MICNVTAAAACAWMIEPSSAEQHSSLQVERKESAVQYSQVKSQRRSATCAGWLCGGELYRTAEQPARHDEGI